MSASCARLLSTSLNNCGRRPGGGGGARQDALMAAVGHVVGAGSLSHGALSGAVLRRDSRDNCPARSNSPPGAAELRLSGAELTRRIGWPLRGGETLDESPRISAALLFAWEFRARHSVRGGLPG